MKKNNISCTQEQLRALCNRAEGNRSPNETPKPNRRIKGATATRNRGETQGKAANLKNRIPNLANAAATKTGNLKKGFRSAGKHQRMKARLETLHRIQAGRAMQCEVGGRDRLRTRVRRRQMKELNEILQTLNLITQLVILVLKLARAIKNQRTTRKPPRE